MGSNGRRPGSSAENQRGQGTRQVEDAEVAHPLLGAGVDAFGQKIAYVVEPA